MVMIATKVVVLVVGDGNVDDGVDVYDEGDAHDPGDGSVAHDVDQDFSMRMSS